MIYDEPLCAHRAHFTTVASSSNLRIKTQGPTSSLLTRSAQHCLMGIRGTVRRSTDSRFVHCNVDTDVIVWEGEGGASLPVGLFKALSGTHSEFLNPRFHYRPADPRSKPPEMYNLIENFCLGTRRLELFGTNHCLRRGWLTVGLDVGPNAPGWSNSLMPTTDFNEVAGVNGSGTGTSTGTLALPDGSSKREEDASFERLQDQLDRTTPREYEKAEYDSNFGVDRPGCELRDRKNLVPFSTGQYRRALSQTLRLTKSFPHPCPGVCAHWLSDRTFLSNVLASARTTECDALRPKSPPPRGGGGRAFTNNAHNNNHQQSQTRSHSQPQTPYGGPLHSGTVSPSPGIDNGMGMGMGGALPSAAFSNGPNAQFVMRGGGNWTAADPSAGSHSAAGAGIAPGAGATGTRMGMGMGTAPASMNGPPRMPMGTSTAGLGSSGSATNTNMLPEPYAQIYAQAQAHAQQAQAQAQIQIQVGMQMQMYAQAQVQAATQAPLRNPTSPNGTLNPTSSANTNVHGNASGPVAAGAGGAGLSGLGAGGPRTVSVPSGSETLSGPQASVLLAGGAGGRAGAGGKPSR